jgi:hypothetical protein
LGGAGGLEWCFFKKEGKTLKNKWYLRGSIRRGISHPANQIISQIFIDKSILSRASPEKKSFIHTKIGVMRDTLSAIQPSSK